METFLQNVRIAVRSLSRAPGFSLAAVLTLALGIGLTTAVFTVANALLLRKLPVLEQDRVVVVAGVTKDGRNSNYPLDVDAAHEYARTSRVLSSTAFFAYEGATPKPMRRGDEIASLRRALVSGNYFAFLGADAILGRTLRVDDDVAGAPPVLVLSYRAWVQQFASDKNIVGRRVDFFDDGASYTIVGVMPQGLDFPRGVDAWSGVLSATPPQNLRFVSLNVIGRLANGATVQSAAEEMTAYWTREGAPQFQRELRGGAQTFSTIILGNTQPALIAFSVAALLLLLITCVNVANLLLVRGLGRAREISVRIALGASSGRVVSQLLVEHLVLAIAGGIVAIAVATFAVQLFVHVAPPSLPRVDEVSVNAASLLALIPVTMLAMVLFVPVPVLFVARMRGSETLRSGTRQSSSRASRLVSEGLASAQVAIALLVLSASMLVGRSYMKLERADLSFDASSLVVTELTLRADHYNSAPKQLAMLDALLPAVRAIPGVSGVAPVVAVPFSAVGWDATPSVDGQSVQQASTNPLLNTELASSDYFSTMGLKPIDGRAFDDSDREGSEPVAILSESAAKQYWGGQSAIGKRIFLGANANRRAFAVVGVVPDTRYRDLRTARPSIYFPLKQSFFPFAPTTLVVRTNRSVASIAPALRKVVAENAPQVAVSRVTPFASLLNTPLAQPRLNALLLSVFAATSAVLAGIGLFGVMATMVQKRTHEFGVRQALGARSLNVGVMVLRRGVVLAAIGCAVGLIGAFATNRLLEAMLFEVSPNDALSLSGTALLLILVAAFASAIPAALSTRISPLEAMRSE